MDAPSLGLALWDKSSSADHGVDIIAVHGPEDGGASTTKYENQTAFLPWLLVDLAPVRIFTYRCHLQDSCSIVQAGDKLLNELQEERTDKAEESQPLIFIGCSLGGLVIKHALSRAFYNRSDESLNEIITATQGIIFLGTPHSPSSSELYTIVTRSKLTEVTMVAVKSMRSILVQFMNLPWPKLPWKIISFYEGLPLEGSTLRAAERNQTKLWDFPQVSLRCNHHDMCNFTSYGDPSYIKVLESLRNIILGSGSADQFTVHPTLAPVEKEVLKSLAYEDVSPHIRDTCEDTCNWIFEHDTFTSWLEEPGQILWLSGKPGSGKSMLSKHIINHFLSEKTESSSQVCYFFFSQRGANQSITSLLRSLLYQQLLESTWSLARSEVFAKLTENMEVLGSDKPWDDDLLMESFLLLIDRSTALGGSFYFFIDALDQCNDPDRVISLFQRLNANLRLSRSTRTYISSRHRPPFKLAREIRIEDNNFADILNYLNAKLLAWQDLVLSILDVREQIQTIAEKAQGMFLWAALVLSDLLHFRLKSSKIAQPLTWWPPMDLEAAYETTWVRMWGSHTARHRRLAQNALTLVWCAQRPLSILELSNALEVVDDGLEASWTQGFEYTQGRWETFLSNVTYQLMILCGGLLEVSPQFSNSANSTMTIHGSAVQFVHETAREFWIGTGCEADFQFQAGEICLTYVNKMAATPKLSFIGKESCSNHFLRYAVIYGMHHLSLASRMSVRPKKGALWRSPIFESCFIDRWAYLHNQLLGIRSHFKPGKTKAAHVMSYFGLPWLGTELWGGSPADIDEEDYYGHTPLSYAAAMGHLDVCKILIKLGADVNHVDHIYGQTPLSLAAANGRLNIVEFLLSLSSDHNDHTSQSQILFVATRSANLEIIKLLLKAGVDIKTINLHTGETALSRAAALGHVPLVSLLLKSGAKIDTRDKRGWTPLHHAISKGRKKTVEVLLEALEPEQLDGFRIGSVNTGPSWVDTVLRSLIGCIFVRQCASSQNSPRDNSQKSKAPNWMGSNGSFPTRARKRSRRNPDSDSEDDCKDDDQGTSEKHPCTNPTGRRFACPYHKVNAERYHSAACIGIGFDTIHRLKQHLKKKHSRALDLQRCHICQTRFPHDNIAGHEPCVKREKPIDYEIGFDAVQRQKLESKDLLLGKKSEKDCWYIIFRVLFPTWPQTREIPSPYQDDLNHTASSDAIRTAKEYFTRPDMINEIVKNSGNEKNIQLVVERGFEEVRRRILRPYSPIESEELDQRSAVNSGAVPQQLRINQPCPRHTANPPPRHSSQSTFTAPNIGGTTSQVEDRPTERYVEVPSYLPLLDPATPFPIDRSYGSYSDPYSADISNSGFLSVQQAGSNMFTAGTSLSDYDSTGRGLYDGSSNVWPISHQSSSPVQQLSAYPRPNSNIGYPHGTMRHINNEDSAIGHVDPSVPSGSYEQQPGAAVAGQINTTQLPESTPGGGSDEHDSVSGPSQAYWYGQGPASQG